MHAVIVKEEIIQQQRISRLIRRNLSLKNIADGVRPTLFTKKRNNIKIIVVKRAVAQLGRALVSKTRGWGFDSLLPCKMDF